MERIGFIGIGTMGMMMVQSFLKSNLFTPKQITIYDTNEELIKSIYQSYNEIDIAGNNIELVCKCKFIFICVKPLDVIPVLKEVAPYLNGDSYVVSIAASVKFIEMEKIFEGQISRVVPTINSVVTKGISLVSHNSKVYPENKKNLLLLLETMGNVKTINESTINFSTILTSVMPGMIATLFNELIELSVCEGGIEKSEAQTLLLQTLYGSSCLHLEDGWEPKKVADSVSTKGGITRECCNIIQKEFPPILSQIFEKAIDKFRLIEDLVVDSP